MILITFFRSAETFAKSVNQESEANFQGDQGKNRPIGLGRIDSHRISQAWLIKPDDKASQGLQIGRAHV